jgi:type IV pilus assembly protein PilA
MYCVVIHASERTGFYGFMALPASYPGRYVVVRPSVFHRATSTLGETRNTMNKLHPSRKGFTLVEIMIVVVIIGLLAAMAIPAFQKVRTTSQDKAVTNNARQIAGGADQYFLENGVSTVAYSQLVGSDKYVKAIQLVANETYPTAYTQGITISVEGVAGVRTVTFAP